MVAHRRRLTAQSKEGVESRSTAPLFGVLTARERRRILRVFQLPPESQAISRLF